MTIEDIFKGYSSWSKLTSTHDDDWVDCLNHVITVVLITLFAAFVTGKTYVGNAIDCWAPAHFKDGWVSYTNAYCWLKNTYLIPLSESLPVAREERTTQELSYYQWIPIILLFMALLFKVPALFWRVTNGMSGINLDKIANMTVDSQIGAEEEREKTVTHIAAYMTRWLKSQKNYSNGRIVRMRQTAHKVMCFVCSKRDGTFLTGAYLFSKLLYVVNVIMQFFLLNAFMGDWYNLYGFEVLNGLARDDDWGDSLRFPKVTHCDFQIRQLQNIQDYTVQCVLPINLFNEYIFILLWFWFVFVAVITVGNFCFWIWRTLINSTRTSYVKKYLKYLNLLQTQQDKDLMLNFVNNHLKDDGIFVLRMIARNTNDILLGDIVRHLWLIYKGESEGKKRLDSDEDP